MVASSMMLRGIGETRLDTLFTVEADPRKWGRITSRVEGWSEEGLTAFLKAYPAYEAWRVNEFPAPPYPIMSVGVTAKPVATKGAICFTGFRNAALEKRLEEMGYSIANTLSKKTTVLVIPDGDDVESSKVVKARESGVPIKKLAQFLQALPVRL